MTSSSSSTSPPTSIPILLLKTRSVPNDGYHDILSSTKTPTGVPFTPTFVPVLEHTILDSGIGFVRDLLEKKEIGSREGCKYGGLIFTSQRAVEAFAGLVEEGRRGDDAYPHLGSTPIYTVGPASSRALSSIPTTPPLQIHGKETGNGEALAHFILTHYPTTQPSPSTNPSSSSPSPNPSLNQNQQTPTPTPTTLPLLFLVGETRRDIIPTTLSAHSIPVTETEVYGTSIKSTFPTHFSEILSSEEFCRNAGGVRWVVVFSPTGCRDMLECLGLLDSRTGRARAREEVRVLSLKEGRGEREGKGKGNGDCEREWDGKGKGMNEEGRYRKGIYIATIGPTTRDYLRREFAFEVDVCAAKPSPEGIRDGILKFMEERKLC